MRDILGRLSSLTAIFLLTTLLSACVSSPVVGAWPPRLPPQKDFVSAYRADPRNAAVQSLEEYLGWVARFYQGSDLMPMGWNAMRESVLLGLDAGQASDLGRQLDHLGVRISSEWAKDNGVRLIDSAMLSLWGSVMQADFAPVAREAAVTMISADVGALMTGELAPEQITELRYLEALDISFD